MKHQHVGWTADGREITATGGVVYDDEYIAAEEAHAQAQRALIIEQYGSLDAYDEHCEAEARQMRRERRDAFARARIDRARVSSTSRLVGYITPRTRERRPAATRRPSSSSSTSSSDPGSDGESSDDDDAAHLRGFLVYLIGFDWPEALIDRAYRFSGEIKREVSR